MKFSIPEPELVFRATRAGGPGGQHVNKASTRMEVLWDFEHSAVLSDEERVRVRVKLVNRIDAEGFLRIAADERRSLTQNRAAAIERLTELVDHARRAPKPRKPTRPTAASRRARLEAKRRRADAKRRRDRPRWED
jgi:ribosome-associated protein